MVEDAALALELARAEALAVSTSRDLLVLEEPVGWEVGHDLLGRDLQAGLDVCWYNHAHWGDTAARATLREDS